MVTKCYRQQIPVPLEVTSLIKLGSTCGDVEVWGSVWSHPFIGHIVSPIFTWGIQELDASGASDKYMTAHGEWGGGTLASARETQDLYSFSVPPEVL